MNGEDYFSSRRTESRVATWHHKQARAKLSCKLLSCQSLEKNEKGNKKPFVQDVLTTLVNFLEQQGNGKWTRKIFSSRCTESWIILLLDITSQHVLACARPSDSIVGTYKNEQSENKTRTPWERGRWRREEWAFFAFPFTERLFTYGVWNTIGSGLIRGRAMFNTISNALVQRSTVLQSAIWSPSDLTSPINSTTNYAFK